MAEDFEEIQNSIETVRMARNQAETLRDQLSAEYQRLQEEAAHLSSQEKEDNQRIEGMDAMRKAIKAANQAIASIDQALRDMERVTDEPDESTK